MQDKAQDDRQRNAANPSGQPLFTEQSGKPQHGKGADVIQKDAGDKHTGSKSPAEKAVHDALGKLNQGIDKGSPKPRAHASADGKEYDGKHGKERNGAAPGQLVYPDKAEYGGESDHDGAFR